MEIGKILKEKRIESGFSIKDVSDATKISKSIISGIEDGKIESLPSGVYVRGYIRTYCRFLKLDEDIIMAEVLKVFPPSDYMEVQQDEKKSKSKNIAKSMVFTVAVMIVLLFVLIVKNLIPDKTFFYEKKSQPLVFTKHIEEKNNQQYSSSSEFTPVHENNQKGGPLATKNAYANREKKYRLEVKATELTWMRNKIDSEMVKEALLKKGDTVVFEGNEGFELTIGNAGGIIMLLNGKQVEKPGKSGEVKKITLP